MLRKDGYSRHPQKRTAAAEATDLVLYSSCTAILLFDSLLHCTALHGTALHCLARTLLTAPPGAFAAAACCKYVTACAQVPRPYTGCRERRAENHVRPLHHSPVNGVAAVPDADDERLPVVRHHGGRQPFLVEGGLVHQLPRRPAVWLVVIVAVAVAVLVWVGVGVGVCGAVGGGGSASGVGASIGDDGGGSACWCWWW